MDAQQSILLAVGTSMMFLGGGLMTYGMVRRRPRAEPADEHPSKRQEIVEAIANLSRRPGQFFGPDMAIKAGAIIMFAGFVMVGGAFLVPSPKV
jgi:uncharacterized membrane protein